MNQPNPPQPVRDPVDVDDPGELLELAERALRKRASRETSRSLAVMHRETADAVFRLRVPYSKP